jgi:hypothetical protein
MQIKHKDFPFIVPQKYISVHLSRKILYSDCTLHPFHKYIIQEVWFSLFCVSVLLDNTKQCILEGITGGLQLQNYNPKNRTGMKF